MSFDYHFMYVDAALGVDWVWIAARRYWIRFRPFVTSDLEIIAHAYRQPTLKVAITALTRRDMAPKLREDISTQFPLAFFDPLVYDYPEEMRLTLDTRTEFGQRFGVDEPPTPTPTPLPLVVATPTYGAKIVGGPGNFPPPPPTATPLAP
jgi:hypothetical protein